MLGIGFLEADRDGALHCLSPRLGEHRRRKVDAGDPMTATRKFEAEEPRTAAGVECVERPAAREDEIKYAVPRGTLGRSPDAVAKAIVETGCPPAPMSRDLLLDEIPLRRTHATGLL